MCGCYKKLIFFLLGFVLGGGGGGWGMAPQRTGSATGFRMKKKQSEEQATSFLFSPWELKKTKGKVLQWEHGEDKRN